MTRSRIAQFVSACALPIQIAVGLICGAGAQSQETRKGAIGLDQAVELHYQHTPLPAMVHDLSKRYAISILVDGDPVIPAANLDFSGSLRQALDRIADIYDYSVSIDKRALVTMMKRFKNPDELPQLNVSEIRQTAIDMLKILPQVPFDSSPTAFGHDLRGFAQTFSPDQFAVLKAGKRLTFADLRPEQREALVGVIRSRSFGMPASVWELLRRQLDHFEDSVLRLEKTGTFKAVDGTMTDSYAVIHETRGTNGMVTKSSLGSFQRMVKQ